MKKTRNEKRVVNIPKENFDAIKEYCADNALDMVSWIVKNTTEKLFKKIPTERITAVEAREIYKDATNVQCPKDWLERVLKDIDESVKWAITGSKMENFITWDGTVVVVNKYRINQRLLLSIDQISIVEKELHLLGFTLTKNQFSPNRMMYYVGW